MGPRCAPSATGVAPAISSGPMFRRKRDHRQRSFLRRGSRRSRIPSPTSLQRQDAEHDGDAGKQRHPVGLPDILPSGGDHRAPGRDLGAHADAEEGEAGFGQHGVGEDERALHQDGRDEVAQHVPRHDAPGRHAERPRRLHIGQFADDQGRGAHDRGRAAARRRCPSATMTVASDGPSAATSAMASRMSGKAIIASMMRAIGRVEPAEEARHEPSATPTMAASTHDRSADEQREPAGIERAREDVAAELVGAEPERRARRLQAVHDREPVGRIRARSRARGSRAARGCRG